MGYQNVMSVLSDTGISWGDCSGARGAFSIQDATCRSVKPKSTSSPFIVMIFVAYQDGSTMAVSLCDPGRIDACIREERGSVRGDLSMDTLLSIDFDIEYVSSSVWGLHVGRKKATAKPIGKVSISTGGDHPCFSPLAESPTRA